jgi:hypothetical protein
MKSATLSVASGLLELKLATFTLREKSLRLSGFVFARFFFFFDVYFSLVYYTLGFPFVLDMILLKCTCS